MYWPSQEAENFGPPYQPTDADWLEYEQWLATLSPEPEETCPLTSDSCPVCIAHDCAPESETVFPF